MRQWADQVESRRPKAAHGLEGRLSLLRLASVAPHDTTHRLVVERLRERWLGRYDQKRKQAVDVFRRLGDKLTVPLEDLGCLAEGPEHRPGMHGADRVQPKQERGDHAEVAAAATHPPEQ